jgi:hypothetical protein
MSQFFNHFNTSSVVLAQNKTIALSSGIGRSLAGLDNWFAYKMIFSESTTINGFVYAVQSNIGGTFNLTVGISTSLGPAGIFPYVTGGSELISNTGTAKTIDFTYSFAVSGFNTSFSSGLGISNLLYVSGTAFTLNPFTPYWIGAKVTATTATAPNTAFYDLCNVQTGDNIINNVHHTEYFYRASNSPTTIGGTHFNERVCFIPFYYDSGTGVTKFYNKFPVQVDDALISYNPGATPNAGREFGSRFELNIFPIQDWTVSSIRFNYVRSTAIDAQYTMRVYDEGSDISANSSFANTIGTSNIVTWRDCGPQLVTQPCSLEFFFNPPLKLRTNKTYFAGIAWTHPTTQPASATSYIVGSITYRGLTSNQSSVFAYRNTVGSGTLTTGTFAIPLNMYISSTSPVSRAIGN